ncbi:MAG TPA: ABC transporter substrate-binding protein [Mycobacteriales bacterium]|jgi:multiple sugar transport system substrate-binding protein|nr:ABC transporter substrate-binding protein [Mycobacteriales bacterium]
MSFRPRTGRLLGALVLLPLLASLSSCGSSSSQGGAAHLNWWIFPEPSGAYNKAAAACAQASHGAYDITLQDLPSSADGQRQQLVRRLAAHDKGVDIMGLDVTWTPEFAEAGWLVPFQGADEAAVRNGTLQTALDTATWKGKLFSAPFNTNTQLLWYRDDLVPNPPKTWDEMLAMSAQLAKAGKPHYVEVQGAQYEGATVLFNTLVASAGGSVLNASDTAPDLGANAKLAVQTLYNFAHSSAADPSLATQMEDANRLAFESGTAAFELNYPFIYPSAKKNAPALFKHLKWAQYPTVKPGEPSHVTIGGIDLAVSSYSTHQDAARKAVECLRGKDNQIRNAIDGGLPPTLTELYTDPALAKDYPYAQAIQQSLQQASVRPKTPFYQNVSLAISAAVSPAGSVSPGSTLPALRSAISDALASKGLVP